MSGYAIVPLIVFGFFVTLAIGISGAAMKDLEARRKR